ncbi:hypothetical protein M5K25_025293 [Dendrobium thyrsiflorum]|uniref:Aminotransferase-like plant mobile domain-containing protein n=1 Tax=Dendrobium thyrsiflorum TaxID=117978 RepID=A0ABD0U8T4_DENTH
MAFRWVRPRSMPDTEPSEDRIWREIDRCDFTQSSSIRDRLSWHQEMLMDRDTYAGLFLRSPRLPAFELGLPVEHDPTDWVVTLRLRHSDGSSLDRIVEGLSYGAQDVLQPTADLAEQTGTIRLLSYSLSRHEVEEQQYDSIFGRLFSMLKGYVCWARYVLRAHRRVLQQAGVYRAIYASLFDYSRLSYSWLQTLVEHWDSITNTCWIGPNEMTITLWDLQLISGLPTLGIPYEECIPPDYDLFRRRPVSHSRRGEFVYSDGLHQSLAHYCRLRRLRGHRHRDAVSLDSWIESLLTHEAYVLLVAQPHDPFGTDLQYSEQSLAEFFEPGTAAGVRPVTARGISEETSLVAFIATWLCYFVLPYQSRVLRPGTLLIASMIATGRRVSLAPAVLARIYRGFGQIVASYGRRQRTVEVPWHYVHGWVHMHVAGAFSCAELPDHYRDHFFPTLLQLARATSATDRAHMRLFMFSPLHTADRFRLVYRSPIGDLPPQSFGVSLADSQTDRGVPTLLSRGGYLSIASYFISMRPGWLCYRRDDTVFLEGYNPNRAARQFGFVQATPLDGLPVLPGVPDVRHFSSLPSSTRLEVAALTWAFLLRLGTGSHFLIALADASTGISHLRLSWIRHTFSSFFELGIQRYSRRIRRSRHSRGSLEQRDCAPTHVEPFRVHGRRRKRSPESSTRRDDPGRSCGYRPVPPPFDRGQPRSRTSYEQRAPQHAPVDLHDTSHTPHVSPILEQFGMGTACTSLGLDEFLHVTTTTLTGVEGGRPVSSQPIDAATDVTSRLGVEQIASSPTLSDSTWLVVSDSLGELSPDAECTHSGSTQLLLGSDVGDTTTELVTHPSLTQVVSGASSGGSSPGVTFHLSDYRSRAFAEGFHFSGLELSFFESRSVFRARRPFSRRWSRGVQYAVAALQILLLRVDLDTSPDLFSFHTEACLLLDFAASCGLRDSLLQMWELSCRTVEFGLFQLQYTSWRLSCIVLTDLETEARAAWDSMRGGRLDLDLGLQALQRYQRDISEEQIELLGIETELRTLRQRGRALLVRRQEIRAVATHTEEDFSSLAADVEHLEDRLSFFTEEFDSARRRLELAEEEREMLQDRLFRVRRQISSIQFRL